MRNLLYAAQTAAWEKENIGLHRRWWAAFKAAHNHIATEWKIGFLIFPHTIVLTWTFTGSDSQR